MHGSFSHRLTALLVLQKLMKVWENKNSRRYTRLWLVFSQLFSFSQTSTRVTTTLWKQGKHCIFLTYSLSYIAIHKDKGIEKLNQELTTTYPTSKLLKEKMLHIFSTLSSALNIQMYSHPHEPQCFWSAPSVNTSGWLQLKLDVCDLQIYSS